MNILAISYFYPPVTRPRAVQVARLMSASGARKLVIHGEGGGPSVLLPASDDHIPETIEWTMPPWRKSIHSAARRLGGSLAGRWESYRPWMRRVLKTAPLRMRKHGFEPDVIVAFGHPWVDLEVGLALKRMLRIPLIAHFSDPWVDNPLVGTASPSARSSLRARESAVVNGSDRLIFTSQETVDLVMQHYPDHLRDRSAVLPHCFDPSLFPDDVQRDDGAVRCLGKFYGDRQPDVLFEALERIQRVSPGSLDPFRFEIIGNYEPVSGRPGVSQSPRVKFRPPVPYLDSLHLMASAEALFLVDAPSEKSVFLPSKLIEYIGAGRPVFGITPPGTADSLIRRYGGMTADPGDVEGVARMVSHFLGGLQSWVGDADVRRQFSITTIGEHFDDLVRSTVASGRNATPK